MQHIQIDGYSRYRAFGAARVRPGRRVAVATWERALLFRHRALVRTLGPCAYRVWRTGVEVVHIDLRPWVLVLPMQEVPSADGVPVKVTVAGRARVTDPVAFVSAVQDGYAALHLAVQVALRELVVATSVEQLLLGRGEMGRALTEAVQGLHELGLELDRLDLRDIVLPGELKRAQAEVLVARAEGQAALERARGETAALRSLANAARLASDNPTLLQLRMLEQLGRSTGHTVVLTAPVPQSR